MQNTYSYIYYHHRTFHEIKEPFLSPDIRIVAKRFCLVASIFPTNLLKLLLNEKQLRVFKNSFSSSLRKSNFSVLQCHPSISY